MMAKMASLHAAENEEPDVSRETNATPYTAGFQAGVSWERDRIIKLLIELKAIRRDALGYLVAFDTNGEQVIYLPGLEGETE